MNERIEQLAIEATKYANLSMIDYFDLSGEDYNKKCNQKYNEKFAELIARAYGNIVLHYTDVDEGVKVANKHFGVEE